MPIYKFYQDVLCTSWERRHFTVTAQNQEEADMIAAQCKDTPLCFDPDAEPGETVYCVFEDETLLETVEPLPITDNHGKPTMTCSLPITIKIGSYERRDQTKW